MTARAHGGTTGRWHHQESCRHSPTTDKPGVASEPPRSGERGASFLNVRVTDLPALYAHAVAQGADFLTEHVDRGAELRCCLRDPDGYLIEVGQCTGLLRGIYAEAPSPVEARGRRSHEFPQSPAVPYRLHAQAEPGTCGVVRPVVPGDRVAERPHRHRHHREPSSTVAPQDIRGLLGGLSGPTHHDQGTPANSLRTAATSVPAADRTRTTPLNRGPPAAAEEVVSHIGHPSGQTLSRSPVDAPTPSRGCPHGPVGGTRPGGLLV
ncbi:VOC family protein [Streptomyces tendae]